MILTPYPRTEKELLNSFLTLLVRYMERKEAKSKSRGEFVKLIKERFKIGDLVTISDLPNKEFKGTNKIVKFFISFVLIENLKTKKRIKLKGYNFQEAKK